MGHRHTHINNSKKKTQNHEKMMKKESEQRKFSGKVAEGWCGTHRGSYCCRVTVILLSMQGQWATVEQKNGSTQI